MPSLVTLDEIRAARELLPGVCRVTPLEGSRNLSDRVGGPVLLKCENLQRAGSFKIRGAYVRIARLTEDERARGVVAASAGNHAQGVALAASLLGCTRDGVHARRRRRCPRSRPPAAYGAEVALRRGHASTRRWSRRRSSPRADRGGVHPPLRPRRHHRRPGHRRAGDPRAVPRRARPSWSAPAAAGWSPGSRRRSRPCARRAGRRRAGRGRGGLPRPRSRPGTRWRWRRCRRWPTGSRSDGPGDLTFAHVAGLVDEVVTVPDEALSRALLLLLERAKLRRRAGRGGGRRRPDGEPGRFPAPVVAVVSGGNIDPLLLLKVIRHGLALGGALPVVPAADPGPARASWRGCWRLLAETRRERARRGAPAHRRRRCTSTRSRWRCGWRPRGPTTATTVLARLRSEGYPIVFG